jgi:hypothetical protein
MVNFKEMLEKIEKLRGQNSAGPDWGTKQREEELEAVSFLTCLSKCGLLSYINSVLLVAWDNELHHYITTLSQIW